MNLVFFVAVAYVSTVATFVSAKPQLQYTLPARARVARGADFVLEDLPLNGEPSPDSVSSSTDRLQDALSSLLALNDGELKSLLMGVPVETVAENLSSQATFLLRASRERLLKLQRALTTDETKSAQRGDFQIAKRRKKSRVGVKAHHDLLNNVDQYENNPEADSLLSAIVDLAQHLEEQREIYAKNEQQSTNTDDSHLVDKKHFHSRSSSQPHFSYWLRAAECPPSADGTPRIYCPSPRHGGSDWVCIEESYLCDGQSHCPNHEDEDPHSCMFYKGLKSQLDVVVGGLLHISSRRS